MSASTSGTPSGSRTREGVARGIAGVREVLDELRNPTDRRTATRPEHTDARADVLAVLGEGPADGYRIVRVLEERGHGAPTPGAGAVYPTLQLLGDEGLATAEETDGRKVWTLTTTGRAAAAQTHEAPKATAEAPSTHRGAILRSGAQLGQVVALAAQSVRGERVGEVVAALDEAQRRILSVLARG